GEYFARKYYKKISKAIQSGDKDELDALAAKISSKVEGFTILKAAYLTVKFAAFTGFLFGVISLGLFVQSASFIITAIPMLGIIAFAVYDFKKYRNDVRSDLKGGFIWNSLSPGTYNEKVFEAAKDKFKEKYDDRKYAEEKATEAEREEFAQWVTELVNSKEVLLERVKQWVFQIVEAQEDERRWEGVVAKSKFSEVSSNGEAILSELIKNGILEEVSSAEVRLKPNTDLKEDAIRGIAKGDFDKIWAILQQAHQELGKSRVLFREKTSLFKIVWVWGYLGARLLAFTLIHIIPFSLQAIVFILILPFIIAAHTILLVIGLASKLFSLLRLKSGTKSHPAGRGLGQNERDLEPIRIVSNYLKTPEIIRIREKRDSLATFTKSLIFISLVILGTLLAYNIGWNRLVDDYGFLLFILIVGMVIILAIAVELARGANNLIDKNICDKIICKRVLSHEAQNIIKGAEDGSIPVCIAARALEVIGDTERAISLLLNKVAHLDEKEPDFYLLYPEIFRVLSELGMNEAQIAEHFADKLSELNPPKIRYALAMALGKRGDKRAIEPLIEFLKNGDSSDETIEVLVGLGDNRVTEAFIELLDHEDGPVRWGAAGALAKMGVLSPGLKVRVSLNELVSTKPFNRQRAINELIGVDCPIGKAIKVLLTKLEAKNMPTEVAVRDAIPAVAKATGDKQDWFIAALDLGQELIDSDVLPCSTLEYGVPLAVESARDNTEWFRQNLIVLRKLALDLAGKGIDPFETLKYGEEAIRKFALDPQGFAEALEAAKLIPLWFKTARDKELKDNKLIEAIPSIVNYASSIEELERILVLEMNSIGKKVISDVYYDCPSPESSCKGFKGDCSGECKRVCCGYEIEVIGKRSCALPYRDYGEERPNTKSHPADKYAALFRKLTSGSVGAGQTPSVSLPQPQPQSIPQPAPLPQSTAVAPQPIVPVSRAKDREGYLLAYEGVTFSNGSFTVGPQPGIMAARLAEALNAALALCRDTTPLRGPPIAVHLKERHTANVTKFIDVFGRVHLIINERFFQYFVDPAIISAYPPEIAKEFSEVSPWLIAERIGHELKHSNSIGSPRKERLEEIEVLRDFEIPFRKRLLVNPALQEKIRRFFKTVRPVFRSGHFYGTPQDFPTAPWKSGYPTKGFLGYAATLEGEALQRAVEWYIDTYYDFGPEAKSHPAGLEQFGSLPPYRKTIHIVGPARSGKSTIADYIAQRLQQEEDVSVVVFNTGDRFRPFTYKLLRDSIWLKDLAGNAPIQLEEKEGRIYITPVQGIPVDITERLKDALITIVSACSIDYRISFRYSRIKIVMDGEDITEHLQDEMVNYNIDIIAKLEPARSLMKQKTEKLAKAVANIPLVINTGRGFISHAVCRLFVTATEEKRARRDCLYLGKDPTNPAVFNQALALLKRRDSKDRIANLLNNYSSIYHLLDTTDLTLQQQNEEAYSYVRKVLDEYRQKRGYKEEIMQLLAVDRSNGPGRISFMLLKGGENGGLHPTVSDEIFASLGGEGFRCYACQPSLEEWQHIVRRWETSLFRMIEGPRGTSGLYGVKPPAINGGQFSDFQTKVKDIKEAIEKNDPWKFQRTLIKLRTVYPYISEVENLQLLWLYMSEYKCQLVVVVRDCSRADFLTRRQFTLADVATLLKHVRPDLYEAFIGGSLNSGSLMQYIYEQLDEQDFFKAFIVGPTNPLRAPQGTLRNIIARHFAYGSLRHLLAQGRARNIPDGDTAKTFNAIHCPVSGEVAREIGVLTRQDASDVLGYLKALWVFPATPGSKSHPAGREEGFGSLLPRRNIIQIVSSGTADNIAIAQYVAKRLSKERSIPATIVTQKGFIPQAICRILVATAEEIGVAQEVSLYPGAYEVLNIANMAQDEQSERVYTYISTQLDTYIAQRAAQEAIFEIILGDRAQVKEGTVSCFLLKGGEHGSVASAVKDDILRALPADEFRLIEGDIALAGLESVLSRWEKPLSKQVGRPAAAEKEASGLFDEQGIDYSLVQEMKKKGLGANDPWLFARYLLELQKSYPEAKKIKNLVKLWGYMNERSQYIFVIRLVSRRAIINRLQLSPQDLADLIEDVQPEWFQAFSEGTLSGEGLVTRIVEELDEQDFLKFVVVGPTNPLKAKPGTLRGVIAKHLTEGALSHILTQAEAMGIKKSKAAIMFNGVHCPATDELAIEISLLSAPDGEKIIKELRPGLSSSTPGTKSHPAGREELSQSYPSLANNPLAQANYSVLTEVLGDKFDAAVQEAARALSIT
ncbi:MAG: (d)CMP kinase, partial [Candidatus Omnitrophica bacterium]|nr:(d)CMP kinase [Candidatus Omnitrophota bacterium]